MGFRTSDAQKKSDGSKYCEMSTLVSMLFALCYEVLRMYDVEKCTAVLENVAGFAR